MNMNGKEPGAMVLRSGICSLRSLHSKVNIKTISKPWLCINLNQWFSTLLATHFFGLKTFVAHLCLIKTKILVLMVIIDEISIVFTCFLVYIKTWWHTLNNSTVHLCVAAHRLRTLSSKQLLQYKFKICR